MLFAATDAHPPRGLRLDFLVLASARKARRNQYVPTWQDRHHRYAVSR
jgi:hypothetical protein